MNICGIKRAAALIMVLSLLAGIAALGGCVPAGPDIEQAVTCTTVTQTGEPGLPVSTFPPDVKTIYCSVKLRDASAKPEVKAEWVIVSSQEAEMKDNIIGSESVVADTPYVAFSFVRSAKYLPKGDYEVRLYLNQEYVQSVPFKIEGEATAPAAILSEAAICTSTDLDTEKPLDKFETLPDNAGRIYCCVKVEDADFDASIKAVWVYLEGEMQGAQGKTVAESSARVEGRNYVSFSISPASGKKFPIGNYLVRLYVEDKEALSVPFKVVDGASLSGPFLSEATTFAVSGTENITLEETAKFAADIEKINCAVKVNNAPPDTELKIEWVLAEDQQGTSNERTISEDLIKVQGTSTVMASLSRGDDPFPAGNYLIKFILNGEEKMTLPFRVQ